MNMKTTENQKRSLRTTSDQYLINEVVWKLLGGAGLMAVLAWPSLSSGVPWSHAVMIHLLGVIWVLNKKSDEELIRQILDFKDWKSWLKAACMAAGDGCLCALFIVLLYVAVMIWAHVG